MDLGPLEDWTPLPPPIAFLRSYFVLLRELEVVVSFQALQMIRQLRDGDGGVAGHACQSEGQRVSLQAPEGARDQARATASH